MKFLIKNKATGYRSLAQDFDNTSGHLGIIMGPIVMSLSKSKMQLLSHCDKMVAISNLTLSIQK